MIHQSPGQLLSRMNNEQSTQPLSSELAAQAAREKLAGSVAGGQSAGSNNGQGADSGGHLSHGPALRMKLSGDALTKAADAAGSGAEGSKKAPVSLNRAVLNAAVAGNAGFQEFVDSAMIGFVGDVEMILQTGFGLSPEDAAIVAREIVARIGSQMGQDNVLEAEFTSVASSQQVQADDDSMTVQASLIMRQIDFAFNTETGEMSLSIQEAKVAAKVSVAGLEPGDKVAIDLGLFAEMGPDGISLGVDAGVDILLAGDSQPAADGKQSMGGLVQARFGTSMQIPGFGGEGGEDALAEAAAMQIDAVGVWAAQAEAAEEKIADLKTMYENALKDIQGLQDLFENMIRFEMPVPAMDPDNPAMRHIRMDAVLPVEIPYPGSEYVQSSPIRGLSRGDSLNVSA